MPELIEAYWPYLLIAFVIGLAIAWFIFAASRTTKVETIAKDVLDDGADPAARNQALIDAPSKTVSVGDAGSTQTSDKTQELTQIKGLGPKIATLLGEMGVSNIAQIASWNDTEIARIDAELGRFKGRIERDNWVEQAKQLSAGDKADFESKFGRNG